MRQLVKRSCEVALASLTRLRSRLPGNSLIILTYHRVLPSDHPDMPIMQPGMVVTPETFRMQLRWLRRYFRIVRLGEWLAEPGCGHHDGRSKACAITFDDGWQDTFHFAFPILQEEQVPATLFLVSDLVGTRMSFWPERLARLLWNEGAGLSTKAIGPREHDWLVGLGLRELPNGGTPDRRQLDRMIHRAKQYPDDLLEGKISNLEHAARVRPPKEPDVLSWEQVRAMTRSCLISIGSHGRTHTRLRDELPKERVESEIKESRNLLQNQLGCRVELFCYPNGDVTSGAAQFVKEHYLAACTTIRGWNSPEADKYRLRRISIHEDPTYHQTGFLAKLSGYL